MGLLENKKGQAESIVFFFVIIVGVLLIAVIMGYMVNKILTPFGNNLNAISPQANTTVQGIVQKFNQTWDYAIIMVFLLNVIILFVSAFLVDVHPFFVFLYIIVVCFMIFLAPNILHVIETVYDNPEYALEVGRMPLTNFFFQNFIIIFLAIIVLSGIIMYAKIKFISGAGGSSFGSY